MILLASEMFKQRVIMGREGAGTVFPGPLNSLDADADTAHGRRRPTHQERLIGRFLGFVLCNFRLLSCTGLYRGTTIGKLFSYGIHLH